MDRSCVRLRLISQHLTAEREEVCIVAAGRSPIGNYKGELMPLSATDIAAQTLKGVLERFRIPASEVKELVLGNVLSANLGQSPARQVALKASLPVSVICTNVNKVCASGMKALMIGAASISQGFADCVAVGGTESMSNVPYYMPGARFGYGRGDQKVVDGVIKDGLWDPLLNIHMGECAERCADKNNVTRADMDRFAKMSYERSAKAWSSGKFNKEIVAITVPDPRKKSVTVTSDTIAGKGLDVSKARPAFRKDGRITAGNASSLSDGAAMLVLTSRRKAQQHNWPVLATLSSYADFEAAPEDFPTAPTYAIQTALQRASLTTNQVDFFEINEAFAVVNAANAKLLGVPEAKLNVYGGAVALGHPIGCSGARIIVTLLSVLAQESGTVGVAAICNGGGGASAVVLRRS